MTLNDFIKDPDELAEEIKLRYISDEIPGITREKKGKGFIYLDKGGNLVKDPKILERIEKLAIPPAWEDVWISPINSGHLQATGRDEKGRKQYLYHQKWREAASRHKFDKMLFFGKALPEIRKQVSSDIEIRFLNKKKILATVVWLLGTTYIRVGNEEYEDENEHFGLTTLRDKHVSFSKSSATFEFVGKSGKKHKIGVTHPKVVKIIKRLDELPGYHLFQYIDDNGRRKELDSGEVNDYLKELAGDAVSAKDFRTWGGTLLAATHLNELGVFEDPKEANSKITQAVKVVSAHLGNTPTMAKNYYIHPIVPKAYTDKILIPHFEKVRKSKIDKPKELTKDEFALIKLLESYA